MRLFKKKEDGAAGQPTKDSGQSAGSGLFGWFKKSGSPKPVTANSNQNRHGNVDCSVLHTACVNGSYYYLGSIMHCFKKCSICKKADAEGRFKFVGSAEHLSCTKQKCLDAACKAALDQHKASQG